MPIIEVKNIGKKYNITHRQGGYITLRDVLTNVFSNPFRFLKQKAKAVAGLVKNEEFWALKDVSFNVEKGEVIGIIGRNGAGKSTLLKILSQITPPTTGEIRINGRVGSLLEVGTGFHPELSGRENIFLNGAILGMKKSEIAKKFDEIVEFAGIEKFLDTPVKYYSSGMYVRLAFSVAAHMDPDVLIIDEVLAVGDADFQKKCLGKMDEITKKEGRTILFVSHNMAAIEQLCKRCILLEKGEVKMIGETKEVISRYIQEAIEIGSKAMVKFPENNNKEMSFMKFWISDNQKNINNNFTTKDDIMIEIEFMVNGPINTADMSIGLINSKGEIIFVSYLSDMNAERNIAFEKGVYKASASIKGNFLVPGYYSLRIWTYIGGVKNIDYSEGDVGFKVENTNSIRSLLGCVLSNVEWSLEKKKF